MKKLIFIPRENSATVIIFLYVPRLVCIKEATDDPRIASYINAEFLIFNAFDRTREDNLYHATIIIRYVTRRAIIVD